MMSAAGTDGRPRAEPDAVDKKKRPLESASGGTGNGSHDAAHEELIEALRRSPKQIPCSYLYDSKGTALYNQVPSRTSQSQRMEGMPTSERAT